MLADARPGGCEHRGVMLRAVEDGDVSARLARHEDQLAADRRVEQRVFDHAPEVARREAACEGLVAELLEHARDVDALAADVPADSADAVRVALDELVELDCLVESPD